MCKIFVFCLIVVNSVLVFAQDEITCVEEKNINPTAGWEYITYSSKEKFYYLKSSIKHDIDDKNIISFYVMSTPFVTRVEEISKSVSSSMKDMCYVKVYYEVNCNENKIRINSNYFYNSLGECIYTQKNYSSNLEDVIPETIGESIFNAICNSF